MKISHDLLKPKRSQQVERLLQSPLRDLNLRFKGSRLEHFHLRLQDELANRGIVRFMPTIYFGDEWYTPDRTIAISVPFYLAHPILIEIARKSHVDVEGSSPGSFMRLLRHECGHAFDHAYRLSERKDWRKMFGSPNQPYNPDKLIAQYNHQLYVKNLPAGYAQTHPFEDFAETFAVWLRNDAKEMKGYRKIPRISDKLSYLDELSHELGNERPFCANRRPMTPATQMRRSISAYLLNPRLN